MKRKVMTTTGVVFEGAGEIHSIIWVGPTSVADDCLLVEVGGEEVWAGQASLENTYLGVAFPKPVHIKDGLSVETLDSAKLFIYYDKRV